jgi:hypothetical protein
MTTELLLPTPVVQRMLDVDEATLSYWCRRGWLVPDDAEPPLYSMEAIDAFLERSAFGFTRHQRPTARNLFDQVDTLITTPCAAERLGIGKSGLTWRVAHGTLPVFKFTKREVRYPASVIAEEASTADTVTKYMAAIIAGVKPSTIVTLVRNGTLTAVHKPGRSTAIFVKSDSLMAYLSEKLQDTGMPPQVWWKERLSHPEPPISADRILTRLRIASVTLEELFEEGRLPYIRSPGGFRFALRRHVEAIAAIRVPYTTEQIVRVLGAESAAAEYWIMSGALCNQRHTRENLLCPRRECIARYIERCRLNPQTDPEEWIVSALRDGGIATFSLRDFPDISYTDLEEGVAAGWLSGVWHPAAKGHPFAFATTATNVNALHRLARRRDRLNGGTTIVRSYRDFLD